MACCVFTAYVMNRIIRFCEILDVQVIQVKYNESDEDAEEDCTGPSLPLTTSKLALEGMTCASCVSNIETALYALNGVHGVSISLPLSVTNVIHDEGAIQSSDLIHIIQQLGYGASADTRSLQQTIDMLEHKARLEALRSSFSNATTAAVSVTSMSRVARHISTPDRFLWVRILITVVLAVWVQLVIAKDIHFSAWRNRSVRRLSMDTLISCSLLVGLLMTMLSVSDLKFGSAENYLSSGSGLVAVVLGGRYVQTLLERQMSTSLTELYKLQSKVHMVQLRHSKIGQTDKVPAMALRPGDEIVLPSRSFIPCDCYVTLGSGLVDESVMTGESLPRTVGTGDLLMSGTRLLDSSIIAVVSSTQDESALEQLVSTVSAAAEKGKSRNNTDVPSTYFVHLILLLTIYSSIATFLAAPPGQSTLQRVFIAGERAMTVLASACPCASGLATPSAVLSGISVALSKGILFVSGTTAIHELANVNHLAMDKTGTLTTGKLAVVSFTESLYDWHYMLLCAAERQDAQLHPVARAIFKWSLSQLSDAQRSEQRNILISNYNSQIGKGIQCTVLMSNKSYEVHIGTAEFLQECGISRKSSVQGVSASCMSVDFAIDRIHIVSLSLQDSVRPETPEIIAFMRDRLSLSLTMLTGDTRIEASRISQILSIPVASFRALPHAKSAFIEQIQSRTPKNRVAMVGDGVNDGPALSKADVGLLLSSGLSATNRAFVKAADVILTGSSLSSLVEAIIIAQMTEKQIRFNRLWAYIYNLIAVTVAMGLLERWDVRIDASMAGTLMAGSSISIITLSLLLRYRLQSIDFTAERAIGVKEV